MIKKAIFAALLALSACAQKSDVELSDKIADKVTAASVGSTVHMAAVVEGPWTRLCIFPPYTTPQKVEATLGFKWEEANATGIDVQEGAVLLVVARGKSVERWVMHPRNRGDFSEIGDAQCYDREHAVFAVERATDGRIVLRK